MLFDENKSYKKNCEQLKEKTDSLYEEFKKYKDIQNQQQQDNTKAAFEQSTAEFINELKKFKECCESQFKYNQIQFPKDLLQAVDEQKTFDQYLLMLKEKHDEEYRRVGDKMGKLRLFRDIFLAAVQSD